MNEKEKKTNQSNEAMSAYEILLKRHLNDDRLIGERSAIFLASSSILFLGFVMLPLNDCLRIGIAVIGLILSIIAIFSNGRTSRGLAFGRRRRRK